MKKTKLRFKFHEKSGKKIKITMLEDTIKVDQGMFSVNAVGAAIEMQASGDQCIEPKPDEEAEDEDLINSFDIVDC